MIILGIDPGSRKTGWAIIKVAGKKNHYIASGVLSFQHISNFLNRLEVIYQETSKLIQKFSPNEIAIESLIYVKNVASLSKLAQARGAMIATFGGNYHNKIFEYSPNLVKSTVTGHGHANKESIEKLLHLIFGNKISFKSNDESDALAIALCHSFQRKAFLKKSVSPISPIH